MLLIKLLAARDITLARNSTQKDLYLLEFITKNLLRQGQTVLHIGGHEGQEAKFYNKLGLGVLWIEAQPLIFEKLNKNIDGLVPEQRAICALLGNESKDGINFNLSNNQSLSSSLFPLGKDAPWEDLKMSGSLKLQMHRLDELCHDEDFSGFSHCVVDVQGAELIVLQGFGDELKKFNSFQIEISTMETYEGGARYEEILAFMNDAGFEPLWKPRKGTHQDMIFMRRDHNFVMSL